MELTLKTALLSSVFTILGGTAIVVAGYILVHVHFDPTIRLRKIRTKILYALDFWAWLIARPCHDEDSPNRRNQATDAKNQLRNLAFELKAEAESIPEYFLFVIPNRWFIAQPHNSFNAAKVLTLLSNSLTSPNVDQQAKENRGIEQELKQALQLTRKKESKQITNR